MNIEFVPNDLRKRNVQKKLRESLQKAKILRGTVAFWTIDNSFFETALIDVLNHPESFYCVDICPPTNFEAILDIEKELCQDKKARTFFVHLKRKSERDNLFHSKVILMEMPNDEVELWVGSHNFTKSALQGVNIESSIVMKFRKNESPIYNEVLQFLNALKNEIEGNFFSEEKYYYFKALQDAANREWVETCLRNDTNLKFREIFFRRTIKIDGKKIHNILRNTIIIIGDNKEELKEIEKHGKTVFIHATDIDTKEEFIFEGSITARDILDDHYSKDVEFGSRRIGKTYSFSKEIILESEEVVSREKLGNKGFYINIEVKERIAPNNIIKVYNWEDYRNLWKEDISNGYEYATSYDNFKKGFLPRNIQTIYPEIAKAVKHTDLQQDSLVPEIGQSFYENNQKAIYIFKKRIFIIITH
jgi:hypothetical protein